MAKVPLQRATPPVIQPIDAAGEYVASRVPPLLPCGSCGAPRQSGSRFCTACGVPFESPNDNFLAKENHDASDDRNRSTKADSVSPISKSIRKNSDQIDSMFGTEAPSNQRVFPPAVRPCRNSLQSRSLASRTSIGASEVMPREKGSSVDWDGGVFHCENCGADIEIPRSQSSLRCPFCDSTYVIQKQRDQRNSQLPEFVIGFAITKEQAMEMFFAWLGKNSWFRPSDLKMKSSTDKQQGVYLPFWHFSMIADSRWSAQIGEYWYRTETYTIRNSDGKTETRTRTVRETEWWPLSGDYRKYYSGYMVSASKGLPQDEAIAIQPFQLSQMLRYRPNYVAGWVVEDYSIEKEAALKIAEDEFRDRERKNIGSFLPGDTYTNLQISTEMSVGGTDLVLLPVHVLTYRYQNKVYRFLVNGQTGKVYGEKPWSTFRITVAIVAIAILILMLIAVVIVSTHPKLGN